MQIAAPTRSVAHAGIQVIREKGMIDLSGKKIVVVGVSADQFKYGHRIFKDLLLAGFNVEGVNAKGGEVEGKKLFTALREIKILPDLVVTVVPPQATEKIVDDCIALKIKEIWMQPGSGSQAAIEKAESAGMKVISGPCIMVKAGIW